MSTVVHGPWDEQSPFDDSPEFLGNDELARQVAPPNTTAGPEFLDGDWDDEVPLVVPTLLPVTGGLPLLYAGESHMLYGEGGKGKSWVGYLACALTARSGRIVVIVDYESNRATVRARLKALGVTKAEASRIAYWKVTSSLMPGSPARTALDSFLAAHPPAFLLLDSIAKAMGAAGFDESKNPDYIRWQQAVVETWTYRRITSLLIDHVGHQQEGRFKRKTPAARGASGKKDQVSGASYFFETNDPWTRESNGRGTLTCAKDREGVRKMWSLAANLTVTVAGHGTKLTFELTAPTPKAESTGDPRARSWYMEQVSRWLETTDPSKATRTQLEKHFASIGKSKVWASEALEVLVEDGHVEASAPQGGRRTVLLSTVTPYRQPDETVDTTKPLDAPPF